MPNDKSGDYKIRFTIGEKEIACFKPKKSEGNEFLFYENKTLK